MSDKGADVRSDRGEPKGGTVIADRYAVDRLIARGGMAAVYAASQRNGHQVAVKLLHPELGIRADIRKRFIREAIDREYLIVFEHDPHVAAGYIRETPDGKRYVDALGS